MATHSPTFIKKAQRVGKGINALSLIAPETAGKLALRIFTTPQKNNNTEEQINFVKAATQKDLILQDHRIRCFEWLPESEAVATVQLVHGWASSTARWHDLILIFLKENYRVIAFDAPAHGFSSGKTLNLGLYSQIIKDFLEKQKELDLIVGHSIGAAAAVLSMTRYGGKKAKKLALLAGFTDSHRVLQDFTGLLTLRPSVEDSMDLEVKKKYGQRMRGFSIEAYMHDLSDVEGLVIHDKIDDIAPFSEGEALGKNWENAEFIATEGLGHSLQDASIFEKVIEFAKK